MDKYQSALFEKETSIIAQVSVDLDESKRNRPKKFWEHKLDKTTNIFEVIQDEDITITKYRLIFWHYLFIDKIYAVKGKELTEATTISYNNSYSLIVDFADPTEKIKIVFKEKMANDLIIKLKYVPASKEAYLANKKAEREKELRAKASIKHSVGDQLINIYFQPSCDEAEKTEIELFFWNGNDWQMIKKCSLSKDDMFLSIPGLAYGKYSYIVRQLDDKKEKLFATERIPFEIRRPNYSGKTRVTPSW